MEPRPPERLPELTERQREVARLVAEGLTNGEIAQRLGISLDGAKYHVSQLLMRLELRRRSEIAEWHRRQSASRRWRVPAIQLAPLGWSITAASMAALAIVALLAISSAREASTSSAARAQFGIVGSLSEARWNHTATLLDDGSVLVVGGSGSGGLLATAERYDPQRRAFTLAGEMAAARSGHTATVLEDGQVLIVGGDFAAELYDRDMAEFTVATHTVEPRELHAAVRLADGRVLIVGGAGTSGASAEVYDPRDRTFTAAGTLAQGRQGPTATLLDDGRVLIAGGCCDAQNRPRDTMEIYDLVSGASRLLDATLSDGSAVHVATRLTDGRVWISTGDVFDPATASVRRVGDPEVGRAPAVLLPDGTIWMPGGFVDYARGATDRSQRFDASAGALIDGPSLREPRQYHTATVLPDGSVLVVGGGVGGVYGDVEIVPSASAELHRP